MLIMEVRMLCENEYHPSISDSKENRKRPKTIFSNIICVWRRLVPIPEECVEEVLHSRQIKLCAESLTGYIRDLVVVSRPNSSQTPGRPRFSFSEFIQKLLDGRLIVRLQLLRVGHGPKLGCGPHIACDAVRLVCKHTLNVSMVPPEQRTGY